MRLPITSPASLLLATPAAWSCRSGAQELEARAFAPNPVGARFAVVSYAHSRGDMLLNSSSPIENFELRADMITVVLGGTFAIADRVASLGLGLPLVDLTATGLVNDVPERADRTGVGGSRRLGRWTVDGSVAVWLFEDNDEFPGDRVRSQEPIGVVQGHLSYTFAPRM